MTDNTLQDPFDSKLRIAYKHLDANRLADAEQTYRDILYESLVTEPEHEVRRLLEFCQLPFEANCLTFHENKRPVKTASGAQVRKPIYRDSLQGWKRYENELQPMKKALEQRPGRFALFASRVIDRWRGTS
jgi:hypothetical protein